MFPAGESGRETIQPDFVEFVWMKIRFVHVPTTVVLSSGSEWRDLHIAQSR
jgi:hypothetical protein